MSKSQDFYQTVHQDLGDEVLKNFKQQTYESEVQLKDFTSSDPI